MLDPLFFFLSFNPAEVTTPDPTAGFCSMDEEFKARLRLNPLYDYAARNWGYHARAASTEMGQSILGFLGNETKVSAFRQAMMVSKRGRWDSNCPGRSLQV
jgi:hypothetical protein